MRQATHKAIAAVTDDLAQLRFNRAVAQLYMLANAIGDGEKADAAARREAAGGIGAALGADDAASGGSLLAGAGPHKSGGRNILAEA